MADRWGQFDNELSGGSDKWDDGLAGDILLADYFAPEAPPTQYHWRGVSSWESRFKGVKSRSQIWLGVTSLAP